ncbi:MAG: hypothetical protein AB7N24_17655 [Dehalococcoidia bacterium]
MHAVRTLLASVALFGAMGLVTIAHADGEAGVVIQDGNTVKTYCIAFGGDGITGDQLLKAAGQTFDAYGGGSGLAVCSISGKGCGDASSFSSCFCQCQGGSCTYWAFFTRSYGKNWVYSALAFNLLKAKDGDVHGWKWGQGGPNSAPAPQDITFEQICGHAPQGGPSTATPLPPTAAGTLPPTAPSTAQTQSTESPSPVSTAAPTGGFTPSVTRAAPDSSVTALVTLPGQVATASPATGGDLPAKDAKADQGDTSKVPLISFGVVVVLMIAAIGAALYWRSRNA